MACAFWASFDTEEGVGILLSRLWDESECHALSLGVLLWRFPGNVVEWHRIWTLGDLGGNGVFMTGGWNARVSLATEAGRKLLRTFQASDGGENSHRNRPGWDSLNAVDQVWRSLFSVVLAVGTKDVCHRGVLIGGERCPAAACLRSIVTLDKLPPLAVAGLGQWGSEPESALSFWLLPRSCVPSPHEEILLLAATAGRPALPLLPLPHLYQQPTYRPLFIFWSSCFLVRITEAAGHMPHCGAWSSYRAFEKGNAYPLPKLLFLVQ